MLYILLSSSDTSPPESRVLPAFCKQNMDIPALQSAFRFTGDRMRRYQGAWHMETAELFPECLFIEMDEKESELVKARLQEFQGYQKLQEYQISGGNQRLRANRAYSEAGPSRPPECLSLIQLGEETARLLFQLGGRQHHIPMSRGVISNGVTHVTEGPLAGQERKITRIDRHKRLAWLPMKSVGQSAGYAMGGTSADTFDEKSEDTIGVVCSMPIRAGLEITSKN